MNFLRRYDNRALIKDDPSKLGAPGASENEIGETTNTENDGMNVSNQDPNEYEIDPSPVKSDTKVTPVTGGRKEIPRLFQRRLFQRTPQKTNQNNQSDPPSKTEPSTSYENENNPIEGSTVIYLPTSDQTNENEQMHDPSPESLTQQNNDVPISYTRTIEPWENWDEDFYSLLSNSMTFVSNSSILSNSMNFVSNSAMTLACALAPLSSLTADLIELGDEDSTKDRKPKSEDIENLDTANNKAEIPVQGDNPLTGVSFQSKAATAVSVEQKFNNHFTLNFIKELANVGLVLTYFDTSQEDFKSNLVLMKIEPGMKEESKLLEPKISWVQLRDEQEIMHTKQSIKILDIHSITAPESESMSLDEENSLHFIITAENGDVHVFESVTALDRDRALYGLRNMIAWLTYNLLTGSLVAPKANRDGNKEHAVSLGLQLKSMNHLLSPFL